MSSTLSPPGGLSPAGDLPSLPRYPVLGGDFSARNVRGKPHRYSPEPADDASFHRNKRVERETDPIFSSLAVLASDGRPPSRADSDEKEGRVSAFTPGELDDAVFNAAFAALGTGSSDPQT